MEKIYNFIHCSSEVDEDRLEFLIEYNKPITCMKCSMEQPSTGYKDKIKTVKSRSDKQLKNSYEKHIAIKEASKEFAKKELKEYTKFWNNVKKKRKKKKWKSN